MKKVTVLWEKKSPDQLFEQNEHPFQMYISLLFPT